MRSLSTVLFALLALGCNDLDVYHEDLVRDDGGRGDARPGDDSVSPSAHARVGSARPAATTAPSDAGQPDALRAEAGPADALSADAGPTSDTSSQAGHDAALSADDGPTDASSADTREDAATAEASTPAQDAAPACIPSECGPLPHRCMTLSQPTATTACCDELSPTGDHCDTGYVAWSPGTGYVCCR